MPRRRRSRLFWRERGGQKRAYGDFRSYADVGGGREALVPPGATQATTDPDVAQVLLARRLEQLEAKRRGQIVHGVTKTAALADVVREHLIAKARAGAVTRRWLEAVEQHLGRAMKYFGSDRVVATITVADVRKWAAWLQQMPGRKGGRVQSGTVRHHLNSLSNLYRRAQADEHVTMGYNPVAALMEKPRVQRVEARWLEVHEAALLLEAARTMHPARQDLTTPFFYPLLATYLLTGGRRAEVLGLEVEDVSFDRRTVTFRPNAWRRLKTRTSFRPVPLMPQLEEILRTYVFGPDRPPARLLFPSLRTGHEAMLTDFRKLLNRASARAGWKAGEITPTMFRHTYCAARLQTLDRGQPVSVFTVGRELGHGGDALVKRVYGHVGAVRHRAEVVEYRVEHFTDKLSERLARMTPVPTP